jgi:hypothetical protein
MKINLAISVCMGVMVSGFAPILLRTQQRCTVMDLDMARRPFISGNWKLNPQTREEAVQLASDIANSITPSSPDADVALFVPYVFIEAAMNAVNGKLLVGAEVCLFPSIKNTLHSTDLPTLPYWFRLMFFSLLFSFLGSLPPN